MLVAGVINQNKRLYLLFLYLLFSLTGFSQNLWLETEVSGEIMKNLELSISPQVRFEEKLNLDEYFFDTGLEYEFSKFLSAGAIYRLGNNIKKKGETESFGRFALDVKTNYEWKDLETQLRLRYTNANDFGGDNNEKEYYFRVRLKIEYSIKKLDLIPYGIYELFRNLPDKEFDKSRYEIGLEYKLTKKHRIGSFYRINDSLVDDDIIKIIGLNYKLKL